MGDYNVSFWGPEQNKIEKLRKQSTPNVSSSNISQFFMQNFFSLSNLFLVIIISPFDIAKGIVYDFPSSIFKYVLLHRKNRHSTYLNYWCYWLTMKLTSKERIFSI